MREASLADRRGKDGQMREARPCSYLRHGKADARDKARLMCDAKQGRYAMQVKADSQCKQGRCAMQGKEFAQWKARQMRNAR
jgi:hypothetical protein